MAVGVARSGAGAWSRGGNLPRDQLLGSCLAPGFSSTFQEFLHESPHFVKLRCACPAVGLPLFLPNNPLIKGGASQRPPRGRALLPDSQTTCVPDKGAVGTERALQ